MIPLGDASRRPFRFPIFTILIIAANTLVFLMELAGMETFINRWSLVQADSPFAQSQPEYWNLVIAAGNRGWHRLYRKEEI
jgi:hypothetical protein